MCKLMVKTINGEETIEFDDGLDWTTRGIFIEFSDKAGKRVSFHQDSLLKFEYTIPWNKNARK